MPTNTNGSLPFLVEKWFQKIDGELRLMGTRCRQCGKVAFPEKRICPDCAGDDLVATPLSRQGHLHTFALSVMGPKGMDAPYLIGFIDLPEKIKLYSVLISDAPNGEDLAIGMPMEMVIDRIKGDASGGEIVSYKFKPIAGGKG